MNKRIRYLVHGALIAAMYVVLTHLQNLLVPNSASFPIQIRVSEALCVLAFFTPAAVPGLTVGCILFNLTFASSLPLDAPVGGLATLLSTLLMYVTRCVRIRKLPVLGLLLPALFNGLLVGWELSVYIGGGFWLNALYVAIGELIALLVPGVVLFGVLSRKDLGSRLFSGR